MKYGNVSQNFNKISQVYKFTPFCWFTNDFAYIYIYIYICVCVCVCVCEREREREREREISGVPHFNLGKASVVKCVCGRRGEEGFQRNWLILVLISLIFSYLQHMFSYLAFQHLEFHLGFCFLEYLRVGFRNRF